MSEPRLLNVTALAAHLGITKRHAQQLIYQRHLPVVKVGRRTYVDRTAVDAYLSENTTPAAGADR